MKSGSTLEAMKIINPGIVICLVLFGSIFFGSPADAQFDKFLKNIQDSLLKQELSEEDIIRGLKEALRVGTGKAVDVVSVLDGYYKNPDIKIPLPEKVKQLEKLLRTMSMGGQVDAFLLSMNRAAERAAPQARITEILRKVFGKK